MTEGVVIFHSMGHTSLILAFSGVDTFHETRIRREVIYSQRGSSGVPKFGTPPPIAISTLITNFESPIVKRIVIWLPFQVHLLESYVTIE